VYHETGENATRKRKMIALTLFLQCDKMWMLQKAIDFFTDGEKRWI